MTKRLNGVMVNINVLSFTRFKELAPKKTKDDYYKFTGKEKPVIVKKEEHEAEKPKAKKKK